jgi:hypothetical protein
LQDRLDIALSLLSKVAKLRELLWHYTFALEGRNRKAHIRAVREKMIECRREYRKLVQVIGEKE